MACLKFSKQHGTTQRTSLEADSRTGQGWDDVLHLLPFIANLTQSVVGIDFGNLSSKIGVARHRGIDIITNEVSNRSTP